MIIEQKVIFVTAVAITHNGKPVTMCDNDGNEVKQLALKPWMKFVAVDASGEVYAFQEAPTLGGGVWRAGESGGCCCIGAIDTSLAVNAWKTMLVEIKPIPGV